MSRNRENRVLQSHFVNRYANGDGIFQLARQLVEHGAPYDLETTVALLALNDGIPQRGIGSKSFVNALKRMQQETSV